MTTGRDSLRRSMETLTECYKWDKRRLFHAVTFGAQAIEYWQAAGDEDSRREAIAYLNTAKLWMEEEQKVAHGVVVSGNFCLKSGASWMICGHRVPGFSGFRSIGF
jgi:hypothetical protein